MANYSHQIVVSSRHNKKPNHYKTVILIISDHKTKGTMGLCLNRSLGQLKSTPTKTRMFLGGPEGLDTSFFLLHDESTLVGRKQKLIDGVYLSPHKMIDRLTTKNAKMINGCTRWSAGELEKEIQNGWWIVDPNPNPELVLRHSFRQLWSEMTPKHFGIKFSDN